MRTLLAILALALSVTACTSENRPSATPTLAAQRVSAAAPNGIVVSPSTEIVFTGRVNGPFPTPRALRITPTNGGNWTSHDTSPWFDTFPHSQGVAGDSCILKPHTDGLTDGTYVQDITFRSPGLPDRTRSIKLVMTSPTPSGAVRLSWLASSSPPGSQPVAGYRVYYGPSTNSYTQTKNVGNQTTALIVSTGTTFYAVTAYNTVGIESRFSNEIRHP